MGGPTVLMLPFFNGLKATLNSADAAWISTFLSSNGLTAFECAIAAFESAPVYAFLHFLIEITL
jgi:hypothetical protein